MVRPLVPTRAWLLASLGLFCLLVNVLPAEQRQTENILLVTLDGLRWQEFFGGCDESLLSKEAGGVRDVPALRQRFFRDTPEERRATLLPFVWKTLATQGQIFGDATLGGSVSVTNGLFFSYPGYSELLTGAPHDDVITSNDNTRYPFLTVLEWLRADLKLPREGIAAYGSWETFNYIAEREEGAITINAGYEDFAHPDPEMKTLSALQHLTPNGFHGARHDIYTFRFGLAHLQTARPRVLYFAFDETDDWAHLKRYDLVLDTLHRTDRQLEQLWTWLQSDPAYRGTTTLILTVDHGRGRTPSDWTDHGAKVEGAEETWIGCFGPAVTARGESRDAGLLYSRQVAGTIAALLGRNFQSAVPGAAAPIAACTGGR
jgi:hypothetical protein